MNLRNFFALFDFDLRARINHLEARILMALNDATARVEASLAALGGDITDQLTAISAEIQQLADAAANGDTTDIETRLGAVADKLDSLAVQVTDSTTQLAGDDAPAAVDPNAPV